MMKAKSSTQPVKAITNERWQKTYKEIKHLFSHVSERARGSVPRSSGKRALEPAVPARIVETLTPN